MSMKKCNLCKKEKEISDFYLKRGVIVTSRCKECIKLKRAEYVKKHYNKVLITNRKRYHRLKEKGLWDGKKEYRERAFKDGLNGFLQTICKCCLSRKGGDINWKFLREKWNKQGGKCALTGLDMTFISGVGKVYTNVSVDRINGKGIYTKDNIRLTCSGANTARGIMTDEQFINISKLVIKNLCH